MSTFSIFLVLITIVCFLLIIVVMVQNPKGGGLSSSLGGTQMLGGVQKTTDFLDKSTWTLAGILIALILLSSLSFTEPETAIQPMPETQTGVPSPAPAQPTKPAPAPAQTAPVEQAPTAADTAK